LEGIEVQKRPQLLPLESLLERHNSKGLQQPTYCEIETKRSKFNSQA
jgi:hypothetical protein